MKHRISLEIDGNQLTVTVDESEHTFVLGEKPKKARAAKKAPQRATTPAGEKKAKAAKPAAKAAKPAAKATPKVTAPAAAPAKVAARKARTSAAKAAPATTAQIRAWAAETGNYPGLSTRGPVPRSLRDDYTAAHAGSGK